MNARHAPSPTTATQIAPAHAAAPALAYALALALALALAAAAPGRAAAAAAPAATEPAGTSVVGSVGNEQISYAQLLAHGSAALATQQAQAEEAQLHLVESSARERHGVLERELGKWLDERALALEAEAQHSNPAALLEAVRPDPVGEDEARQFYEARKGSDDPDWNQAQLQIGDRVRQFLGNQHLEQAQRRYLDGLRARHGISDQLAPYRVAIPAGGQVRGKASAPVTLVEFGDFQCPYCQRAQPVVQALLAQHPDELRLVFRHFPLARVHPNARSASFAAECARQQDRFWEMHDAMYVDQEALNPEQLQVTAVRIGLNGPAFAKCLADPATARVVDADLRIGAAAGVNGTPSFFLNGRPVPGDAVGLERMLGEELARARAAH